MAIGDGRLDLFLFLLIPVALPDLRRPAPPLRRHQQDALLSAGALLRRGQGRVRELGSSGKEGQKDGRRAGGRRARGARCPRALLRGGAFRQGYGRCGRRGDGRLEQRRGDSDDGDDGARRRLRRRKLFTPPRSTPCRRLDLGSFALVAFLRFFSRVVLDQPPRRRRRQGRSALRGRARRGKRKRRNKMRGSGRTLPSRRRLRCRSRRRRPRARSWPLRLCPRPSCGGC